MGKGMIVLQEWDILQDWIIIRDWKELTLEEITEVY